MLTDADFADDLVLLSDKIGNAEKLLNILETAAASVGLYMNTTKTKFIAVNTEGTIAAQNGRDLEQANDFNYLECRKILNRKTPNTDTFHAVSSKNTDSKF